MAESKTASKVRCAICEVQQKTNFAIVWCPECEEALCSECHKHHQVARPSKGHTTILIENYLQLPSFILNVKLYCEDHNEKYQHYCMNHERPLCKKCLTLSHKKCSDVQVLDDIIGNVKTSFAIERVSHDATATLTTLKKLVDDRKTNVNKITQEKDDVIANIRRIKNVINKRLDLLEETILSELNAKSEDALKSVQQILKSIEDKEGVLRKLDAELPAVKKYASNFQTFIGLKEIEKKIHNENLYLTRLIENNDLDQVTLSFKIDDNIQKLIDNVQSYGNIEVSRNKTTLSVQEPKLNEAQIVAHRLKSANLQLKREVKLDEGYYTGCCTLSNGNLVFADYNQDQLDEYDTEGSLISNITLKDANDVVAIDDFKVAVSCYGSNKLLILDMKRKQIIKTIDVESPSSITYKAGTIILCAVNQGIQSCCLLSSRIDDLYTDETISYNSYVTLFKNGICYTSPDVDTVTVLDSCFKLLFKFQDDKLLQNPRGVAISHNNYIYVAGCFTDNVVAISPDGKESREILTKEKDGLTGPISVHFDKKSKQLIVTDSYGVIRFYTFH